MEDVVGAKVSAGRELCTYASSPGATILSGGACGCSAELWERQFENAAGSSDHVGRCVVGERSVSRALPRALCTAAVGVAGLCFRLSSGPAKLTCGAGEGTLQQQCLKIIQCFKKKKKRKRKKSLEGVEIEFVFIWFLLSF